MATKTEQALLDRVREENDRGNTCWNPVRNSKGVYRSWRRGGHESGPPNKVESAAWARMVERGDVIKCSGGYVVPGHPLLVDCAAALSLPRMARAIAQKRQELEEAEADYAKSVEFIRKYGLDTSLDAARAKRGDR